jgi:hypothetical protein
MQRGARSADRHVTALGMLTFDQRGVSRDQSLLFGREALVGRIRRPDKANAQYECDQDSELMHSPSPIPYTRQGAELIERL